METIDITKDLPNEGSNRIRLLKDITHAVVHHDGVHAEDGYDPLKRAKSEAQYHIKKGWKRLAYHFKITRKGAILKTNPLEEITWHAGNYKMNLKAIGICLDGDLTKQRATPEQVKALWEILIWLTTKRPDMPGLVKKTVKTHREVRKWWTSCPSNQIQKIVEAFRQ